MFVDWCKAIFRWGVSDSPLWWLSSTVSLWLFPWSPLSGSFSLGVSFICSPCLWFQSLLFRKSRLKADSDGDEDEATFDWQSVVVPASNNRVKHLKLALADIPVCAIRCMSCFVTSVSFANVPIYCRCSPQPSIEPPLPISWSITEFPS